MGSGLVFCFLPFLIQTQFNLWGQALWGQALWGQALSSGKDTFLPLCLMAFCMIRPDPELDFLTSCPYGIPLDKA